MNRNVIVCALCAIGVLYIAGFEIFDVVVD